MIFRYYLVCNRVFTEKEGKETTIRIQNALKKFLNKEATVLGYLPDDRTVSNAVSDKFLLYCMNQEQKFRKL